MKILICGRPNSGKTVLAKPFSELIGGVYLGEEEVNEHYQKYSGCHDFVSCGIGYKMLLLSDGIVRAGKIAVIDCVCEYQFERDRIDPDFVVWMDTLKGDDLPFYTEPTKYNYHVSAWFDDTHKQLMDVVTVWMQRNRE